MKKRGIILLIAIYCAFQALGCSGDGSKQPLMVSLLGMASMYTIGGSVIVHEPEKEVIAAPSSLTATDGQYQDKVGINWGTVSEAVSYRIYRASSVAGPFTSPIATLTADDLANIDTGVVTTDPGVTPDTVTTPTTGDTCTNPVMQATYQSTRDIGDGIRCHGGLGELAQHYTIHVYIGGKDKGIVEFRGYSLIPMIYTTWTQSEIVEKFNEKLGSDATCYPVNVDGRKYIKIVSNSSIELKNSYSIGELLWIPLQFLDLSAGWNTVYKVNPVQVSCNDSTPPTVAQVSPASGATNIALNAKVSVAFSEAINTATLTASSFTLSVDGANVAGTVSSSGVFTPNNELTAGKEYTATITTAVTDLAGNHLASNYTWKFTTSSSSQVSYFYVDSDVAKGSHYYYVVTAVDAEDNESLASPVEEGFTKANDSVPSKVPGCSASEGQAGGITVTWTAATNATYYRVYRIESTGLMQVGGDIAGTSYMDTAAGPGIISYKVAPFNGNGEGGSSDPDAGYRTVSNEEFFSEVYRENVWALDHIEKLNSTDPYDMLGTETLYDSDGNGTLVYNASANLSQAIMKLTFSNFSAYYLIQNTEPNAPITATLKDPLGDCKGPMTGKLLITGVYNGYVRYDLQMTGGTVTGGSYWVSQDGGAEYEVPYDSDLVY